MGQKIIQSYSSILDCNLDCCQQRKQRNLGSLESRIANVKNKKLSVDREYLLDHKDDGGDDVPEITPFQLKKLGRYQ